MAKKIENVEDERPIKQLLYIIRWAIIILIFAATRLVDFSPTQVDVNNLTYALIAMAAATALFYIVSRSNPRWRNPVLGIAVDILLVTVVIYFSDGIQSPFYPLYFVAVISSAATFGMSGALWGAVAIAAFSIGIEFTEVARAGAPLTEALIWQDIAKTVPYLFLIAIIAGTLRDRIRVLTRRTVALSVEHAAWEREMEVASSVQRAQLPPELPRIAGIEIIACYKPAREVGGDLYDFYPVTNDHLGIIVADVAGKGVAAALMVSMTKYAVYEHYLDDHVRMMRGVNEHVSSVVTDETFVTMLYGSLNIATREFKYINAGHMPPIVVRPSTRDILVFSQADVPLGVAADADFSEQVIQLESGDILVLYTDGVTDALAFAGDGMAEFQQLLLDMCQSDLSTWENEIMREIIEPRHLDDVTVVAVKVG